MHVSRLGTWTSSGPRPDLISLGPSGTRTGLIAKRPADITPPI